MKSCISNIFFYDYGGAPLTLFDKLRNFLNNRKSLMTVTLITMRFYRISTIIFLINSFSLSSLIILG